MARLALNMRIFKVKGKVGNNVLNHQGYTVLYMLNHQGQGQGLAIVC
jgi:hypothetical protein